MPYTVFISHSVDDADYSLVVTIANLIWQNGMQAFVAEWMPQYGQQVSDKVAAQIDASDIVLALVTNAYSRASFANQEIGYAKKAGKLIIPLLEEGVRPSGFIFGVDSVKFNRSHFLAAAENVTKYLKRKKEESEQGKMVAGLVVGGLFLWILSQAGRQGDPR